MSRIPKIRPGFINATGGSARHKWPVMPRLILRKALEVVRVS